MKRDADGVRVSFLFSLTLVLCAFTLLLANFRKKSDSGIAPQVKAGPSSIKIEQEFNHHDSRMIVENSYNSLNATLAFNQQAKVTVVNHAPDLGKRVETQIDQSSQSNVRLNPGKAVNMVTLVHTSRNVTGEKSSIAGKVVLIGTPPPEKVLPLDPSCGKLFNQTNVPTTHFFKVGENGTLADVFVYIKDGLPGNRFSIPKERPLLNQQNCEFVPYVMGLQTGQTLLVRNSDPLLHNVHSVPNNHGNPEKNFAQLPRSKDLELRFPSEEIFVKLKCDVHQWMFAWIGVVEHPFYAVTLEDGRWKIEGLTKGDYTVEIVHRKLGKQQIKVHLEEREEKEFEVSFNLNAPSSEAL